MIVGNSLIDKAVTGESNVKQNAFSSLGGSVLDKVFPPNPIKPFAVEGVQKTLDKKFDGYFKEEKNERDN